jgi:hypothetical protein
MKREAGLHLLIYIYFGPTPTTEAFEAKWFALYKLFSDLIFHPLF